MPILAAFALANLKSDLGALWKWLCHRSFWQLVSMGLLGLVIVQHFQLAGERRHSAKVEAHDKTVTAQLKAISSKKNEQKAETSERIKVVTKAIHDAEGRAKVIEAAPLPGECKTPSAVLQADI